MIAGEVIVSLAFGLASAATIWFAALSSFDAKRKRSFAALLFMGWAFCNLAYFIGNWTWPILFDAIAGLAAISMWRTRRAVWLRHLYYTYLAQLSMHCVYQVALAVGIDMGYAYAAALNILFLCQLWIIGNTGMRKFLHGDGDRGLSFSRRYRDDGVFGEARQRHK